MNIKRFNYLSKYCEIIVLGIALTISGCENDDPKPDRGGSAGGGGEIEGCQACNTAECIAPGITSLLTQTTTEPDTLSLTETNISEVSQKSLSSTTVTIAAEEGLLNILSIINDNAVNASKQLGSSSIVGGGISIRRNDEVVLECADFAIGFDLLDTQPAGNANFLGNFSECIINQNKSIFGEFSYIVTNNEGSPQSNEPFNQQSQANFADFCVREDINRVCLSGDAEISYYSTNTPSVKTEISGSRLDTITNELPLSLVSYSLVRETFADNTFLIDGSGVLAIPNIEGSVTFNIVTSLAGNSNGEIITGALELSGSNGSKAVITVLDASNLDILIDANGNGEYVQILSSFSASEVSSLNSLNVSAVVNYEKQLTFSNVASQASNITSQAIVVGSSRVPVNSIEHVIHISVDGLSPKAISALGEQELPNFYHMRNNGSFTDNARTDESISYTLPNHISQLTGRYVLSLKGHGWLYNDDEGLSTTVHEVSGSYISSVFDMVHDYGLTTAFYVSKGKFQLLDNSWNEINGAGDNVGLDNGNDKIDQYVFDDDVNSLVGRFIDDFQTQKFNYTLLHLRSPDSAGHASGWSLTPNSEYLNAVKSIDSELGRIIDLISNDSELLDSTVIILTADHGGVFGQNLHLLLRSENLYDSGVVPFYVFGANFPIGDLYSINSDSTADPGELHPYFFELVQPIRNGDAANFALKLLGLPDIPGSTIKALQLPEAFNTNPIPDSDNSTCNIGLNS